MMFIARRKNLFKTFKRMYTTLQGSEFGRKHLTPGIGRLSNLVIEKGEGCYVWDTNGKKYLDFTAGIAVTNTGHCHPKVVKAVQEQVSKLIHGQVNIFYHKAMLGLIDKLLPKMPHGLDTFSFHNSGAEAIENAIKVARHYTGKPNVIVFQGGFHGRTIGTLSLTTSKTVYRAGYGPLMSGVFVTPFPYCFQCPVSRANRNFNQDNCCNKHEMELELMLKQQTASSETAAILIEPILGEGGYVVPPPGFLKYLRKFCTENNILLILDEVQSGFYRTGKLFAFEHFGITPDIIVMAKGLGSGFPISAIAVPNSLTKSQIPGSMGGTYSGNAVACAAATATLEVMEDPSFVKNIATQSATLMNGLQEMKEDSSNQIVDVRGLGLMIGIELKSSNVGLATKVAKTCLNNGMLVLSTGSYETIRFMPPLVVNDKEAKEALSIFKSSLKEANRS
eukprot:TRINITY_DN9032_c0_g3_i2.p1 TRINITY_DN9032_c0_g3~~TRINITY_DN9032_c0_g3_i2.p1  ORF type:complete len:449 (+),score=60.63 TRINITY_DN9032_c0_g3_i2:65-1411(+)